MGSSTGPRDQADRSTGPPVTRSTAARLLGIAGTLLSIGLIAWVIYRGARGLPDNPVDLGNPALWAWWGIGTLLATAATFLLPDAWSRLVAPPFNAGDGAIRRQAWCAYATSQVYKYLPGNVFHFVGRQVQLSSRDVSQVRIANATLMELLSQVSVAGLLFLALANTRLDDLLQALPLGSDHQLLLTLSGVLALAGIAAVAGFMKYRGITVATRDWVGMALRHLGYYLMLGVGFWAVCRPLHGDGVELAQATLIFTAAWLAGTIIPGASAGIGVREAVILSLGGLIAQQELAVAAGVMRLATTLADGFLWVAGARRR